MMATRVALLFGGPSAEHDVSILSADSLIGWLSAGGCEVVALHLRRDGRIGWRAFAPRSAGEGEATALARLPAPSAIGWGSALERLPAAVDVAFPMVHGSLGEDGSLQGFLRVMGLPCVGCGVLASALAMDKQRAKQLLMATTGLRMPLGVALLPHEVRDEAAALRRLARLRLPLIVKPLDCGSSYGLTRVTEQGALAAALRAALAVEGATAVLAEEQVEGIEVTCALVGDAARGVEAFPPILIRPRHGGLFDLAAKYTPGATDEICPAPLPATSLARIGAAATEAYLALGCSGFARVDFILVDGTPWFLELNTLPGLTRESLFPKAARAAGHELPALFRRLVEEAREPRRAYGAVAS